MKPGTENTRVNQHVCLCHKCSAWVDKFWRHYCSYVSVASHRTVIYIAAMLFYRTVWPGKIQLREFVVDFSEMLSEYVQYGMTMYIFLESPSGCLAWKTVCWDLIRA